MFPNLRRLAWKNNQTYLAIEFLRMAFVSSLVSFNLQISSISPALTLLSTIGTACPNLTSCRSQIGDLMLNREIAPILKQVICRLRHLSVLTVCELEDQGMGVHCATSVSEETLALHRVI